MNEDVKEDKAEAQTSNETPGTSSEYKSDHLTVLVERKPGCRVKFNIDVTPLGSQSAYKKAVQKINKEVSLPGFRKGRAPEAMIVKNYGTYVNQEWKEILVQTAFQEAMKLSHLYPLNQETIQKPQITTGTKDEGASIAIEFECGPEVPEIDPKDLALKKVEKKEVTQQEIEQSIDNIRLHHAEWTEVSDRAVQESDYIDVDIEDMDRPGQFICKDTRFEVAKGKMGDWMRNLVIGKQAGEMAEGVSERSEEMDPNADFKPTRCKITIKTIRTAQLPEVNEELTAKLGASSVEDFNEKVVENLKRQAEEEVQHLLRGQLEEILLEKYPFDIPASLTSREIKNRLEYAKRQLRHIGKTEKEISEQIATIEMEIAAQVEKAFRMFFLARSVADKYDIEVTQNEMVRELMLQMYSQSSPIDSSVDTEEARSKVYINLLTQKVKDHLIGQATIE